MEPLNIEIHSDSIKGNRVVLDGTDITHFVRGVSFWAVNREMPVIGIEFVNAKVKISGDAFLQRLAEGSDTTAAEAVRNLDWSKIEQRALDGLGMDDNLFTAVMKAIVEELGGSQS